MLCHYWACLRGDFTVVAAFCSHLTQTTTWSDPCGMKSLECRYFDWNSECNAYTHDCIHTYTHMHSHVHMHTTHMQHVHTQYTEYKQTYTPCSALFAQQKGLVNSDYLQYRAVCCMYVPVPHANQFHQADLSTS